MRFTLFILCFFAMSVSSLAAVPTRPALSDQLIFSAEQIVDVDPAGTAEEATLFAALQSLIERFGMLGAHYPDKSVRMNLKITAEEAEVALISIYEQLTLIGNAAVENELAERSDDDAAQVIATFNNVFEVTLNPAPTCKLMAGTKFAAPPSKKVKALKGNVNVSWAQALACLPGAKSMPMSAKSYNRSAVKSTAPITRGEFLHKLNDAAEASYAAIGMAGSN
jgi:hypothetical protein